MSVKQKKKGSVINIHNKTCKKPEHKKKDEGDFNECKI